MACSMVRRIVNDFPVQKTRAICIKRLFFFWIQYELKYTRPHRVLQHFANQIVRYLFIRPAQIGKMWTTNNLLFIEASTQMQYDIITEFIIGVFIFSKINGKPAKKKFQWNQTHILMQYFTHLLRLYSRFTWLDELWRHRQQWAHVRIAPHAAICRTKRSSHVRVPFFFLFNSLY